LNYREIIAQKLILWYYFGAILDMKKIMITSAYCNPIHPGHIECFNLAKDLGDELWVIVNNDKQAELKRGVKSFQDEAFRLDIVKNIKAVDKVLLSIDTDPSVVESIKNAHSEIKRIYPEAEVVFAKGGDRFASEIPEGQICADLGIKIVDGLGTKTHNSREYVKHHLKISAKDDSEKKEIEDIAKNSEELYLEIGKRPWGTYFVLEEKDTFKVKRILVNPKSRLSLQSHKHRKEHWVVVRGVATIEIDDLKKNLQVGEFCDVPLGAKHRLSNETDSEIEIVEVQFGDYMGEDDIVRYEDDYKRI
jgi:mannose-6-phosphate isomerase